MASTAQRPITAWGSAAPVEIIWRRKGMDGIVHSLEGINSSSVSPPRLLPAPVLHAGDKAEQMNCAKEH